MLLKSRTNQLNINEILPLLNDIANKRQEHFIVLTFDSSMQLINKHLVFLGTVSSSLCHPREVFAVAIEDAASSIVICHNHPSGDPHPSGDDIKTTQQLIAAGIVLGIPVNDHIIIAKEESLSFLQEGLILGID